jgi:hypothetical protein
MKRILLLFTLGVALIMASCTKEGPQGKAGKDGTNGAPGADGADGVDASITCGECHELSDDLTAIMAQFEHSKHYETTTAFEGNRSTCSPCHTSQGFRSCVTTGFFNAEAYEDPAPINCRTCHKIHETYTAEDWNFRTTSPVRSRNDSTNTTWDMGTANTCINCHQARVISPMPNLASTDSLKVPNTRFGPHHGPQANLFAGIGKSSCVEIPGSMSYLNSSHTTLMTDACVTCHMGAPVGTLTGGHSVNMYNEEEGYALNACTACHTAADAQALITNSQTEIADLMSQVQAKLVEKGLIKSDGVTLVTGKNFTQVQVAALLNYKTIEEDKSMGVHNFKYSKALLSNSLEALSN